MSSTTPSPSLPQPTITTLNPSSTPPTYQPENPNKLNIYPPLINTACPWATTKQDLRRVYECPYTGAVTIRTCLWEGFAHDDSIHQYAFFDAGSSGGGKEEGKSSLNTLGYSPIPFLDYISILRELEIEGLFSARAFPPGLKREEMEGLPSVKPFIVSVTGTPEGVALCAKYVLTFMNEGIGAGSGLGILTEVNLSCPNITGKEPPAYNGTALGEYIEAIGEVKKEARERGWQIELKVGIKTPTYTCATQFSTLVEVLERSCEDGEGGCPIDFITATNTLGSCLLLGENSEEVLNGNGGIGGMAGDAIHCLSLGNVRLISEGLARSGKRGVREVVVVGVGGVRDSSGYERMRKCGAGVVGLATGLGREGIDIFEKIWRGVEERG